LYIVKVTWFLYHLNFIKNYQIKNIYAVVVVVVVVVVDKMWSI